MIPKIIHFINIGNRPFRFIHFLAIYTAHKVNAGAVIYMHLTDEPTGEWWEKAKAYCTLKPTERIDSIYGNPIGNPAHMADVIRLNMLSKYGGIYLDLDVVCINSFEDLSEETFVMGIEPDSGLCNAVILADPEAEFLAAWRESYRSFDTSKWNYHSVVLPWKMAMANPERVRLLDKYSFFYPQAQDLAHRYLWGKKVGLAKKFKRLSKNLLAYTYHRWFGKGDPLLLEKYGTFHLLYGNEWHYEKAANTYCIHLWEGFWREPYLNALTPDSLLKGQDNFSRLMRQTIGRDELSSLR